MKSIEIQFPGVKALDKVDFDLSAGEVHALLGENGAGKSTLIKCLTGVLHMDAGKIIYDGREIAPSSPQAAMEMGISTVYQEINLCQNLTVAENIFVGRQPMKRGSRIDWKSINSRAEALLSRFNIHIDVTRPLDYYSTGIQQMVSIARAVDVKAKILILDEPTSSLDENEVERLFDVVRDLKKTGMGIIFITHFLDQVFQISDRLTVLRNGRLVGDFATDQISKIELVRQMIGKDMAEIFALKRPTVAPDARDRLEADSLGVSGKVENVSFTLREGELIGFAGLLGSGRTETAEMVFGVTRAERGSIRIDGKDVRIHTPFDAIGHQMAFCPEDRKRDGIIGDLSVRENIALVVQSRRGILKPMGLKEQTELAEKYIRLLGIATPDAEKKVGELSGGNQQKVILARWMATQPEVLILDEPTRGIDVGAKAEIQRLMLKMCAEGVSVIFHFLRTGRDPPLLQPRHRHARPLQGGRTAGRIEQTGGHPPRDRGRFGGGGGSLTMKIKFDSQRILKSKVTWAVVAELLILLVCLIIRPEFFKISYQESTGMLYGSIIDILNRSSEITIIALGMTLVIALAGTDLSVGALVALSGAMSLKLMRWDMSEYPTAGDYSVTPLIWVFVAALGICLVFGCFNGLMISRFGMQPIIATLVLMVAGRGVAQIITNGRQMTTNFSPFKFLSQGSFLFLPMPIIITAVIFLLMALLTRKTSFGMFVESVGINPSASRCRACAVR
jgi:simple sugar transport system ATP-binding protein